MTSPDVAVYHADCLELDAEFFASFDVQLTDFPYSEHVHEHAASNNPGPQIPGQGPLSRDLGFDPLSPELRMQGAICAAAVRRWSAIFADHEGTHEWREYCASAGAEYVRLVPWIRWSQPQLSGDRPPSGSEAVLLFHAQHNGPRGGTRPIAKHWNGPGSLTHFSRRCMRGQDKHPTEKGLDLMLDQVSWLSDPGEAVIDLCAGSGTTALACRLLGRSCASFERDGAWARRGAARVSGPLSARDHDRATRWVESTLEEAGEVPEPRAADGSDVRTWERAQRRIADAATVAGAL